MAHKQGIQNLIEAMALEPTTDRTTPMKPKCRTEKKKYDITFIIDGSGSVGSTPFQEALTFVNMIVDLFAIGPDNSRVSVISFNDNPIHDMSFDTSASLGKEQTKTRINTIAYPGGATNTKKCIIQ